MKKHLLAAWVIVGMAMAVSAKAKPAGLVETTVSPFAKVASVGMDEVRWTNGFWAERFRSCSREMVPGLWLLMEGTNYTQFYQNFRIAAGLAEGKHRGAPFNDGDFYKWLEGACAVYAVTKDSALGNEIKEVVEVIAKAQRADGYIHTPVLIKERNGDASAKPFQDPLSFETYNMGHLMTAACVHYRVTGRTNLLTVARKAADFLEQAFREPTPELARMAICPAHYMGVVELYRTTREPRYLALAKKFFAMRDLVKDGGDDNQDRVRFEDQTNAMGHAVRANYLYAGAADLFAETGQPELWTPLERIWTNVVEQKMYLTGGCGALFDGASPDGAKEQKTITRVHQSYGRNYQLPNSTAHSETCANIGNVLWNWRMFLVTGEARFVDVAELALYNSVLSGGSLDGTNFLYVNPLRHLNTMPADLRWPAERRPFMSSFCCPPNLARIVAESADYAYAKSSNTIWVNLYGGNTLATTLSSGEKIKLSQATAYPWNGRIWITVDECGAGNFGLKLRIPGWAAGASVRVNGKLANPAPKSGTYWELRRKWRAGDAVDLDLEMETRLVEANLLVEETLNQVAVQRGPVVYCLESADLPQGMSVMDVMVPQSIQWRARYDKRLLGGVAVIEGQGMWRARENWDAKLYRDVRATAAKPVSLKLIPYFAWGNRGAGEMTVWMLRGGETK